MSSVLITGANRGLGLGWARYYASAGWRVFATCRDPEGAKELHGLARSQSGVKLFELDVTRSDDIDALSVELKDKPIDVLLNNAGVYFEKYKLSLGQVEADEWMETFKVNTIAPMRMAEAFLYHVARSDRRMIVAITSHMGSIAEINQPGSYYYRSSKAALNAAMKGLSVEVNSRGVGVLMLHPGWVRTRMGGPEAPLTVEESVKGMAKLVSRFTMKETGRFYRFNGTEIPW